MVINEFVSVNLTNNKPQHVVWKNKNYKITQIGLHHSYRQGTTLYHVFSVTAGNLFLRLNLDTENLLWKLEEVESEF